MIDEESVCYVLIAEDPLGEIIICQEFCESEKDKAIAAFAMIHAPKVVLFKQECKTKVIAQILMPNKKGRV